MSGLYAARLKRPFDLASALLALLGLLPILASCGVAIWAEDRGSIIFRQRRVGRDGRLFTIYKFRSMRERVPDLPSDAASALPVTTVGRFIRRTNLDELPQLWNVVRGDMSLVGPRPALPSQAELLSLRASSGAARIRPGLTGLAQVMSYDGMPLVAKAGFDARYASSVSLLGDFRILLLTMRYAARRPPVY